MLGNDLHDPFLEPPKLTATAVTYSDIIINYDNTFVLSDGLVTSQQSHLQQHFSQEIAFNWMHLHSSSTVEGPKLPGVSHLASRWRSRKPARLTGDRKQCLQSCVGNTCNSAATLSEAKAQSLSLEMRPSGHFKDV